MIPDHERLTGGLFRSVNSLALFKEFFSKFKAWESLQLKENPKNGEIHDAWVLLSHPKKEQMNEALCRINDLSREEGRDYLDNVCEEAGIKDYTELNLAQLALTLFLRNPSKFNQAYDIFTLEKLDGLKILVGREPVPCAPNAAALERFRNKLRTALQKAGEGPRLKIEVGPHPPDRWVLVIPHENFVKPDHAFNDKDEIITKNRRPVYELVVIYYPAEGLIKLKVGGKGMKKAEAVASVFATEFLGKRGDHFQVVELVRFDPLFRKGFDFQTRPSDDFEWARPVEMKFKSTGDRTFTWLVRCHDTFGGKQDVIEKVRELGFTPDTIKVESLAIQFQFPGGGRKKRRTVTLVPHNYDLDETPRDRHLEQVLIRWGFIDVTTQTARKPAELAKQAV